MGPNPEVRDGPSMNARAIGSFAARASRQNPDFQYSPLVRVPSAARMIRNGSPLFASRTSSRTTAPGFSRSSGMPPSRGSSQPSGPRKSSFLMSTRGVTSPRHMMSSIITKSQLDVCGAPDEHPACGAPRRPRSSGWPRARTWRAGSSSMFLSRMPPRSAVSCATTVRECPQPPGRRSMEVGPARPRERPWSDETGRAPTAPAAALVHPPVLAGAPRPVPGHRRPRRPVAARRSEWGTLRLTTTGRRTGADRSRHPRATSRTARTSSPWR